MEAAETLGDFNDSVHPQLPKSHRRYHIRGMPVAPHPHSTFLTSGGSRSADRTPRCWAEPRAYPSCRRRGCAAVNADLLVLVKLRTDQTFPSGVT